MPIGWNMLHEPDVGCPGKVGGIPRATQHETPLGHPTGRLNEELLEYGLTITSVGAEIGEVGAHSRPYCDRAVCIRIHMTIEGGDATGAETLSHSGERVTAGIAEHEVEIAEPAAR
jgi:hypothetical protein